MKEKEKKAVQEFKKVVMGKYANEIIDIKLFGSKIRGDDTEKSDIDILIILKNYSSKIRNIISDLATEVSLEFDVLLSISIDTLETYNKNKECNTFFYQNIVKDFVIL